VVNGSSYINWRAISLCFDKLDYTNVDKGIEQVNIFNVFFYADLLKNVHKEHLCSRQKTRSSFWTTAYCTVETQSRDHNLNNWHSLSITMLRKIHHET
jgi:hypothetical protein